MNLIPFAWTVENGRIRFSESVTGTIEVLVREDIDPNNYPDFEDSLFNGDRELTRLYTPMVRAHVRMKLAERKWKNSNGQEKREAADVLALSTAQYREEKKKATSLRGMRESGVIRMQPVLGRLKNVSDWSDD